jgi:hypothetical protein
VRLVDSEDEYHAAMQKARYHSGDTWCLTTRDFKKNSPMSNMDWLFHFPNNKGADPYHRTIDQAWSLSKMSNQLSGEENARFVPTIAASFFLPLGERSR